MASSAQELIATWLRWQAAACRLIGSPLYDLLLTEAAADVEGGGPVWAVLEGHESDARDSMLGLRFMAAMHRLVLGGEGGGLDRFYPSVGGEVDSESVWPAFRALADERCEQLRALVERPCQTNEVGRSAVLLGGFLMVARDTGLPLRLLEIGASAGLNLCFDRYFYSGGGGSFGDPGSRVRFKDFVSEGRPPFEAELRVAERSGCDARPLNLSSPEDRLTLMAAVWADQIERMVQLRGALDLAATDPPSVEQASAGSWLERLLQEEQPGTATVVYHSLVWHYLEEREQERIRAAIASAGERATAEMPLAWVRMEKSGELADVTLTAWPGGGESLIARAGYHGRPVEWLGL